MSDKVQGIKATPIGADRLIIRDTEDSDKLKEATLAAITEGVLHTDVDNEIALMDSKPAPNANDYVVIEDSEDSFSKKKIPLSTLGGGGGGIPDAPVDTKVYARQDGAWVDPSVNLVTTRVIWEPALPPQTQLCLVNDVSQVITYTEVTLADPKVSIDLGLGEITILEDLIHMDLSVDLQIIRENESQGSYLWGAGAEVWDGLAWIPYPDSTRYFAFNRQIADDIRHLSFSISFNSIAANTKFRLVQICDDVAQDIGLISDKPFTTMPQSAGIILNINTR